MRPWIHPIQSSCVGTPPMTNLSLPGSISLNYKMFNILSSKIFYI